MDLFQKALDFTAADEARASGLYPYFHALESKQDTEVVMDGKPIIMLGSNNYMGLTSDPRTIKAAQDALLAYGTGCSGSRYLNGTLRLHEQLEAELADFFTKEAAITFSTGFQTNLGIISGIVGRHDYILNDSENHASILDGSRLSFAKRVYKYAHSDMDDLARVLKQVPQDAGILIITDGVFSMSGDLAKLPDIVTLAKQYGARILVDDAHGVGMVGPNGRGTAHHFGLENEVDLIMTTFSKSLASLGGCVVGDARVLDFIKHNSRPFIFSASIPPANAGTALEALRILKAEPERQKALIEIASYMRQKLREAGIPIVEGDTAIIPIYTYDMNRTFLITRELFANGVYVNPVIPPAVPEGQCMLRTSYTATHTRDQMDRAAAVFKEVFSRL